METEEKEQQFNLWIKNKIKLDNSLNTSHISERDVFWCALGKNIGDEEDGKGESFARPVLVLKKFNNHLFWGLPLTTKNKENLYYVQINFKEKTQSVMISHLRLFDKKRLNKKIGRVGSDDFNIIKEKIINLLQNKNT
jgi:mRNA interferase MazF